MSRIELPSQVSIHVLRNLFTKNAFFPTTKPEFFTLVFHPKFNHLEPFGLAMLASWATHWRRQGVGIRCENLTGRTAIYLRRMGLFNHLPVDATPIINEHEEAGRFVTLQKIGRAKELEIFLADLMPLLHMSDHMEHARAVRYCLSEITQNVIEHAGGAPAFVCAQYYKKAKIVAIGVADCGVGVRQSLSRNYSHSTDEDAILSALKPGVTGAIQTGMYGSIDNAGAGLFFTRSIARSSNEYFAMISGSGAYRLLRSQRSTQDILFPVSRDPKSERHNLWGDFNPWTGTIVAINIGVDSGSNFDFSNVMRTIGEAFNSPSAARPVRPKPKINFTP